MRVLSGIQPSGRLHLGNYFGAIRQYLELQEAGHSCFYFVANYHALTSLRNREELEEATLHVATAFMALGLDPSKSVFFLQSDVPQVTELAWVLNCVCPMGMLERAIAYKDKIAKGITPNVGLFDYPVLQAADIVIYGAELVPVGADQKQHIEITRDLAARFNREFGAEVLVVPEPFIVENVAVVPGIDGQKMSKSYNNTIELFADPATTKKRCMQIVTDSTPLHAPKDPSKCNVFALLKLFASREEAEDIAERYRAGGYGYGHAKTRLAELINEHFAVARARYAELMDRPDTIRDVLREGGKKAREVAEATMERVREVCGLLTSR